MLGFNSLNKISLIPMNVIIHLCLKINLYTKFQHPRSSLEKSYVLYKLKTWGKSTKKLHFSNCKDCNETEKSNLFKTTSRTYYTLNLHIKFLLPSLIWKGIKIKNLHFWGREGMQWGWKVKTPKSTSRTCTKSTYQIPTS